MTGREKLAAIAGTLVLAVGGAACRGGGPTEPVVKAERWHAADRLFHQDPRWLGSDGAYSVFLGGSRVLWLFGDTFIANGRSRVRSKAAFIRNSIGLQEGLDPTDASMSFYWRQKDGRPSSFFPGDGDRWYWPKHGLQLGRTLVVFLSRIKSKPKEPCCFNFAADGWRLAAIDDSPTRPEHWTLRIAAPPAVLEALVPEAVNVVGEYAVALALGDDSSGYLVRWRVGDLAAGRLGSAEWWTARGWMSALDPRGRPMRVVRRVGPEASVSFEQEVHRWVLVWTQGFGAATLVVSFAPRLEGPWTVPIAVYHPPEGNRPGNLIYAGKGHPELEGADLPVTYVASTAYYPRFVKLAFSSHE